MVAGAVGPVQQHAPDLDDEADKALLRRLRRQKAEAGGGGGAAPVATVHAALGSSSSSTSEPLSVQMRRASRQAHKLSDALINAKLAVALLDRDGVSYASALRLFLPIYLNLEKLQLLHKDNRAVGLMPLRAGVAEAILKDLHHFGVTAPFVDAGELEAAAAYVAHLRTLSEKRPELLCAYIYSLHMALLSGGRIIGAAVSRTLRVGSCDGDGSDGSPGGGDAVAVRAGLQTFALAAGERDAEGAKASLRAALDAVGAAVDAPTRAALVAEGARVFEMNNTLVRALSLRRRECAAGAARALGSRAAAAAATAVSLWLGARLYVWSLDVM